MVLLRATSRPLVTQLWTTGLGKASRFIPHARARLDLFCVSMDVRIDLELRGPKGHICKIVTEKCGGIRHIMHISISYCQGGGGPCPGGPGNPEIPGYATGIEYYLFFAN